MFFDVLHELVVGGQVLELFDKDELESIFNLLAENEHHKPSAGHSDGQLPDIFSKESIYTTSHYCNSLHVHTFGTLLLRKCYMIRSCHVSYISV